MCLGPKPKDHCAAGQGSGHCGLGFWPMSWALVTRQVSSFAQDGPCDTHCEGSVLIATKEDSSQHLRLSTKAMIEHQGKGRRGGVCPEISDQQDGEGKEIQAQPTHIVEGSRSTLQPSGWDSEVVKMLRFI